MTTQEFVEVRPFRLLVAGYININVIDGSAFFMAALTAMCARYPGVQVTLVTANPIRKTEVLDEVMGLDNVEIIDPYVHPAGISLGVQGEYMTRERYAQVLAAVDDVVAPDAILIRDNESAVEFISARPSAAGRTTVYVTGVRHTDDELPATVRRELETLDRSGVRFCVQTPVMRESLAESGFAGIAERAFVLPPHVPDAEGPFEQVVVDREQPHRLVYTGKFVADWIPDRILAGFKAAAQVHQELRLDVAGDQFRQHPDDPLFVANVKYLLEQERVTWHGRLPRAEARDLIRTADLGVSWRSAALDTSTELSTKVLEYGALGKPVIVNRSPMHESILGSDYGFFVNSRADYRRVLLGLRDSRAQLRENAERCYEAARPHWYSNVAPGLLEALGCHRSTDAACIPVDAGGQHPEGDVGLVRPILRGPWIELVPDLEGISASEALTRARLYLGWREQLRNQPVPSKPVQVLPPTPMPAPVDGAALKESQRQAEQLRKKLALANQQRDVARTQLENLRRSKLGSMQQKIWKLKQGRGAKQ